MIRKIWTWFAKPRYLHDMSYWHIAIAPESFTLTKQRLPIESLSISWADIYEMRAYKADLYVYDMICIGITYGDGQFVEIYEVDGGYSEFLKAAEAHLPDVRMDLFGEVVLPAFQSNERVFYKRP